MIRFGVPLFSGGRRLVHGSLAPDVGDHIAALVKFCELKHIDCEVLE